MTATYDAANRMSTVTLTIGGQGKSYTLTHDANGNLTQKQNTADSNDSTSYSWDSHNRLTQITQPGLTASFSYDAFGRRIQSTITQGGTTNTVQYLYEGQQALGEIRDGRLSHRLLTGLNLNETIARLAVNASGNQDAANSRLYMTDALNSVIAQLNDDDNAGLANSYAYSPYGESQTVGVDAAGNPIQYTSRENDGTGLMYYRARYYDAVLKRFVSEDPAGFVDGFNKYGYVQGDPVSLSDPTGEFGIVGGVIGAGVEIAMQAYRNYRDGCDLLDFDNYDWADVGAAALVGAVAPGWLAVGKTAIGSGKAIGHLHGQLQRARTVNRASKIQGRINDHKGRIADVAVTQAAFQGIKYLGKEVAGSGKPKECGCEK